MNMKRRRVLDQARLGNMAPKNLKVQTTILVEAFRSDKNIEAQPKPRFPIVNSLLALIDLLIRVGERSISIRTLLRDQVREETKAMITRKEHAIRDPANRHLPRSRMTSKKASARFKEQISEGTMV